MSNLTLTPLTHHQKSQIAIGFKYNEEIKTLVKAFPGVRWSATHKTFYVPQEADTLHQLFNYFREHQLYVDYSAFKTTRAPAPLRDLTKQKPKANQQELFTSLPLSSKALLKNYTGFLRGKRLSNSTLKIYGYFVLRFLDFIGAKPIEDWTVKDLDLFFDKVLAAEHYSISSHRQCVSALKYLGTYCNLDHFNTEDLKRPKKSKKLPVVLSKEEVIDLMQVTKNLKHRAIIGLIYSSGLRIGELLQLKLKDIDLDRNQLHIRQAKGRKDRTVIMSEVLKPLLLNYLRSYQPNTFFVEGHQGGGVFCC